MKCCVSRFAVAFTALVACASPDAQPVVTPPEAPPASPPAAAATNAKLALLVGVDDYKSPTVNDLRGCVNDIRDIESLLTTTFEFDAAGIRSLPNDKATRAAILGAFREHLIDKARPGDVALFYYSGHGSRMRDASGDETGDGMDETIVPHDSRQGNVFDITDDELNALVRQLLAKTDNVTVILDSCHSGSGARGISSGVRLAPDDLRTPPPPADNAVRGGREGESDLRDPALDYVLISGARSDQLANEYLTADAGHRGALSWSLSRVLRGSGGKQRTYREVMEEVAASVSASFPTQSPQIEGLRADNVVFGASTGGLEPFVLVSPAGAGQAKLQGGSAMGIGVNAELDVYAPRTRTFDTAPVARLRVTRVRPFEADADVIGSAIQPLSRAVLRKATYADNPLRIAYDASASAIAPRVRELLREYPGVVEASSAADAVLVLRATAGGLAFHSRDQVPVSPAIDPQREDAAQEITRQALEWSKWFRIGSIRNPAPNVSVALDVREKGGTDVADVAMDDVIEVTVRNTSNQKLYITVIDLSNDGSSAVWYPPDDRQEFLQPGAELKREFAMWVPDGRDSVVDTIKVFATAAPIDANVFRLAPVKAAEALPGARSPLESFIEESVRGKRGGSPVELGGWTTAERTLTVRRNGRALLTNFVAHFEGGRAGDAASVRAALPECRSGPPGPCYHVRALSPDETVVEITPGGTRGADAPEETADAWDEAYRIRERTGAARVEPSLEFVADDLTPDTEGTRGGDGDDHNPNAEKNAVWSLQHANVPAAWKLLQDRRGRRSGEEGREVIVGHPDTGYRRHSEIWNADPARSAVLTADGYDYIRNIPDAEDQLEGGAIANPGHGTKSSSVIVSAKGKQHTDASTVRYVEGVAPGARIVPLRVHKSVVQLNPARLAKAIYDVSSGSGDPLRRKADVISISMGGVPTWALWKAVRFAEKQGVIVVAAAGNKVGTVVWPARFSETVAVAASNVDCGIWSGSSRGPAVDITAPGESVWHASPVVAQETVKMGKGTTYATATTAGVAALWLDYHRSDPATRTVIEQLKRDGQLTSAFRNALANGAWRPDRDRTTWPADVNCAPHGSWSGVLYGPGIVDAAKTLQQPLGAPRSLGAASLDALPLFGSLFDSYDPELVVARYQRIFPGPARPLTDVAMFEAEIMQQYERDAEVRAALDSLVTSQEPTAQQLETARRTLLAGRLSARLRAALTPPPQS